MYTEIRELTLKDVKNEVLRYFYYNFYHCNNPLSRPKTIKGDVIVRYYGERADIVVVDEENMKKTIAGLEEVVPNLYSSKLISEDDGIYGEDQFFVYIHNGMVSHCFAVHNYKMMTEDDESIQLHSVYIESYNMGCGEYVINKKTGELTIKPLYCFDNPLELDDNVKEAIAESQKLQDDDILDEYGLKIR